MQPAKQVVIYNVEDDQIQNALEYLMKAITYEQYGPPDVLQLREVAIPVLEDDRVLVQVHAAALNKLDQGTYRGPFLQRLLSGNGFSKPKDQRVGVDLAGRVESVGKNVTQFKPGDEVFGRGPGAFAEYSCPRESSIALKPNNVSFEAAAAVPVAAISALQGLRNIGQIQSGQSVLIYGAGGGMGTFAVQIAKSFDTEVTAVCGPQNVDIVNSIGADHVIDYTREDFTQKGKLYDLILAVNGYHSIFGFRRLLTPTGRFVLAGASEAHLFPAIIQALLLGPSLSKAGGQKLGFMGIAKPIQADLVLLKELIEAGKLSPVIDRKYPINETAEAFRYFEKGHIRGKVILTVEQHSKI